jgi:hypothetical protein
MDQLLRENGGLKSSSYDPKKSNVFKVLVGLKSSSYRLVFIGFFAPKKSNVFKVLAFVVFREKTS